MTFPKNMNNFQTLKSGMSKMTNLPTTSPAPNTIPMLQTEDVSTEWGWPLCSLCVKAEYVQSALSLFHSSFPQTYRSKGFQGLRSYIKKLNCVKPAWIQSMYKFNVCLCCFSFVLCIFSPYCQNSQNSAHHRIAVLERHTEGERALCPWARCLVEYAGVMEYIT